MQALTVLHLEHTLVAARGFLSSAPCSTSQQVVGLPSLARLFVAAPLSAVVALLSCIDIPSKTRVRLEVGLEDEASEDDYAQLASLVAQRFSQSEDLSPTIRSLTVRSPLRESTFAVCASERSD